MPDLEALAALRELAVLLHADGSPFVLVGAGARVLLLDEPLRLGSLRATDDWDLGVQTGSWEGFRALRSRLEAAGFLPDGHVEHRFRHARGVPVDLVPFGGLEHAPGRIRWPRDEGEMAVLGFAEALESADVLDLDGVPLPVARLPLQAVLKFFAFDARRDPDDLTDLRLLLLHGADYDNERIFTELGAWLADGILAFEDAGAALLGLDAARLLRTDTARALLPIAAALADPGRPELAWLIRRLGDEADEARQRAALARSFAAFLTPFAPFGGS